MTSLSESTHTHGPITLPRETYPTTTERKHTSKVIEDHEKGQGLARTTQDTVVKNLDIGVSKDPSKGRNNPRSKNTDDNTEDLARWKVKMFRVLFHKDVPRQTLSNKNTFGY